MGVEGETMADTVSYTRVAEAFDGRVTVDELKTFSDGRGFVCELWRTDDGQMNSPYINLPPKADKWNQKIVDKFYKSLKLTK